VFNLVGKRYLFLIISLIIIIPGVISLLIKGMNVGIDFAGGATVELRPSVNVSLTDVRTVLKPLNLADLQVLNGNNAALTSDSVVWVRLNTWVDDNVKSTITKTLQDKYGQGLVVQFQDLPLSGKKTTVVVITKFSGAHSSSDIQTLLSKLPNTTDPSKPATTPTPVSSPAVGVTPTAGTGKSTPVASPTAKATATSTTGKGTPTPTPGTNSANIAVKVVTVQTGQTTGTVSILTRTQVSQEKLLAIQAALLQGKNAYSYTLTNASVSPSVASETSSRAILAVVVASLCILGYIWLAFRKVAKPWRYGVCAIIALLHDVLLVLGVFSILGWTLGIQIDTLFITALLTVVGFSVHDTIVVFDRIRENMQRRTSETFDQVVNASLVQTMARSLNTSLTVLFTLSALTLFGGVTIRTFTLALLVGIFSGTYSSIFNASMLLVIWEKGELGLSRFNRRRTPDGRRERELVEARR
jgi:preprotein translocase SecF subunit